MNITFLIGNGFDMNMGLETSYTAFLKKYLRHYVDDSEDIIAFKKDIENRIKTDMKSDKKELLWANAELALGDYTSEMVKQGKSIENFFERYDNFCNRLATYLQEQEARIKVGGYEQKFAEAIQNYKKGLSEVQQNQVQMAINSFGGGYIYNFIIFNYTEIIDKFVLSIKNGKVTFKNRVINHDQHRCGINNLIHVHGTTKENMVLGVNDESQIGNLKLFENKPSYYLNGIIKKQTNDRNEARIDAKASAIIADSSFIYIYGMSLGETDKIWWQRIIARMKKEPNMHIFIHSYDAPKNKLILRELWRYVDNKKQQFLSFSDGDTEGLADRIHIVDANLFDNLANIALPEMQDEDQQKNAALSEKTVAL